MALSCGHRRLKKYRRHFPGADIRKVPSVGGDQKREIEKKIFMGNADVKDTVEDLSKEIGGENGTCFSNARSLH